MAATVAASKSYNLLGAQLGPTKEDLEDMIYDISPMDTVFMNTVERGKASSTVHEWLTDALVAASANAKVEGDDFTAVARTPPQRLKNYCQISRKDIEVTGTANAVDNAGMAKLMAYFTARAGKEIKRDMEVGFLQNVAATSGGASLSARVSAGAENWIYIPNHLAPNGTTTATTVAPASGFATGAVTDGSATVMVETDLKALLQQAWSTGGETDVILCGPTIYNKISTFTGIATRFRNVESRSQAQIIGAADVYVSAFGTHKIMLSRYSRATTIFAFDMSTWAIAYLRPFQVVDIAKIGDAERKMLLAEYTLVCRSPSANTKFTNVTG
jgi:hypothetical protein